ncbi:MAG TPA: amino acid adenylation domain-containing protein, partial [Pyrinomonadaceae bacterium]
PLIGFFVNTLVLRTKLEAEESFVSLLARVREVCLGAYAHQEVPFERIVEELRPERELSHNPLFQVLFALQNIPAHELTLADLKLTALEIENPVARFDLALEVAELMDGLECRLTYDVDLFSAATIKRLGQHFVNLVQSIVGDSSQSVSTINLLSDEERRQLLFDWNDTQIDFPRERCIHELFEEQAVRTPDATALVFGDQRLSYRALNERANAWAHRLLFDAEVVTEDHPYGLCVERSVEMIVGLLAILKAGGAYVPLAPDTPRERLQTIVNEAGIKVLLTQEKLLARMPGEIHSLALDGEQLHKEENPATEIDARNLAYVIFTSGSTGSPKGVEITHRNLVHSTTARFAYYEEPVKSFVLISPFFFDSSVAGIFWTLCQGGKLVLPAKDFERDLPALATLIETENASHILCLPAVYSLLLRKDHARLKTLNTVIVAGEACPPGLPQRHFATMLGASLYNEYGPTEATVWSTVHKFSLQDTEVISIGRPIPNAQTYVLDQRLQPVPVGVVGEIYIAGAGLARGYLNNSVETARRFVPHLFSLEPGARLYATGDLARYLEDGDIEYLGRPDQQIKLRGYRVELGEIESALSDHPGVREAAIVVTDRIVAYVTTNEPAPAIHELREFLRNKLPAYMLPSQFEVLDAMPLSTNGKLDRSALPAPNVLRRTITAAPQTPLEKTIAEVWQEFLKLETVGVNDVFFELGGHSLLLVLVHEELQRRLAREIAIADLFNFPTVRALAQHLDDAPESKSDSSTNRERANARRASVRARSRKHSKS